MRCCGGGNDIESRVICGSAIVVVEGATMITIACSTIYVMVARNNLSNSHGVSSSFSCRNKEVGDIEIGRETQIKMSKDRTASQARQW